jgi:hypothetical protein
MSYNLGTDDDPIIVFVEFAGGMIDATIRCTDKATFLTAALHAELMYELTTTVVDPDTLEETQVGTGEYAVSKGVDISHIGPMQLTAGVYDADGDVIASPIMDTRHHVNFRLSGDVITNVNEYGVIKWQRWAMEWTLGGTSDSVPNATEVSKTLYGVDLIDMATINSHSRVWL